MMDFLDYVRCEGEKVALPNRQRLALAHNFLLSAIGAELRRGRGRRTLGVSRELTEPRDVHRRGQCRPL
jgi:hypothetical protein